MDDDSTDDTSLIVQRYASQYSWISYLHNKKRPGQTYYASNVYAIEAGYEHVRGEEFQFIAVLDADICIPPDYYSSLISRFEHDSTLGIASGIYYNLLQNRLEKAILDRRSTPKALQVFRRECFEQIGGYLPMNNGGEDTCSCAMARMNGWKTWSFPDLHAIHLRPPGRGHTLSRVGAAFIQGLNEYGLATHPIFLVMKSLRRCIIERPFILSGIMRIAGYIYGWITRERRQIPDNVVKFIRREQIKRLTHLNKIADANRY